MENPQMLSLVIEVFSFLSFEEDLETIYYNLWWRVKGKVSVQ